MAGNTSEGLLYTRQKRNEAQLPRLDRSEGRDREARRVTLIEVPTKGNKRPAEMRFLLITPTWRTDIASKALYVVTSYFSHTSPPQSS